MTSSCVSDDYSAEFTELERQFGRLMSAARQAFKEQACALGATLQPFDGMVAATLFHRQQPGQDPAVDPGLTATEIAERLDADKSMLSRSVKRLEAAGLLQRRTDTEDARAFRLHLSELARQRLKDYVARRKRESAEIFEEWTRQEITTLASLLGKINDKRDEQTEHVGR